MKKILVIDDHKETREIIAEVLRTNEFTVMTAPGGREGIQIAKMKHPDVILLDMKMPNYDGIQTCKTLKRLNEIKNIPVIFLSADRNQEDIIEAVKAGGRDYITKPFSPDEVITRIHALLEEKKEKFDVSSVISNTDALPEGLLAGEPSPEQEKIKLFDVQQSGEFTVIKFLSKSLTAGNYFALRDLFERKVNEGRVKIFLDIARLETIDGTGLAQLIHLHHTLTKMDGCFAISIPLKEASSCFSFINLNSLFPAYKDVHEAEASKNAPEIKKDVPKSIKNLQVCPSCLFINSEAGRFCAKCGANLKLGTEDTILRALKGKISQKILLTAKPEDFEKQKSAEKEQLSQIKTPQVFLAELKIDAVHLSFKCKLTDDSRLESENAIYLKVPRIDGKPLPLKEDVPLILKNSQLGNRYAYTSRIILYDPGKSVLEACYTPDAKLLHSDKAFSIYIRPPAAVTIIDPYTVGPDAQYDAYIRALSRNGMIVQTMQELPLQRCLTLKLVLPDGIEISTPLCIAQKGEQDFNYNLDYVIIDEKERSEIIKHMYKCQIKEKKKAERSAKREI